MIIFQFRVNESIMSMEQSMTMSTEPRHLRLGAQEQARYSSLFLQVDRILNLPQLPRQS
jgi:hypothetical protein